MMQIIRQFRYPLILFLTGFLVNLAGAWSKIMHFIFADILLIAGMMLQGIALLIAIYILFRKK